MVAEGREMGASKPNADNEEAIKEEAKAQTENAAGSTDKHAARISTPDIAKMAPIRAAVPRESSQQTSSGRTIHLSEPPILPSTTPLTTSRITTSVLVPDTQVESSANSVAANSRETGQTTLYGFFRPAASIAAASDSGHSTSARSDEETSSSNTSEGSTPPSPVQNKIGTSIPPIQVIGKRKRDDETVEAINDVVSEPVKPIKKARRGFSLKSAVSHTVSLAAGAVMAVAFLSVMPELDA